MKHQWHGYYRRLRASLGLTRARFMDGLGYSKSIDLQLLYPVKLSYQSRRVQQIVESRQHDIFVSWLFPGVNFLDVGANFGRYSLYAASRMDGQATVVAIEADPLQYRILNRNMRLNAFREIVTTVQCAAWDRPTVLEFFVNRGGRSSAASGWGSEDKRIVVEARTLDDLCEELGFIPDVVKMDIEGAECRALEGMRKILATARPKLLLELHPQAIESIGGHLAQIQTLLIDHSYQLLDIESNPVTDIVGAFETSKTIQALPINDGR